jgi:hypothetical protein
MTPNPVPNIVGAVDSVNRSILHRNADGTTIPPVATTLVITKRMVPQGRVHRIFTEALERGHRQLFDVIWQTVV